MALKNVDTHEWRIFYKYNLAVMIFASWWSLISYEANSLPCFIFSSKYKYTSYNTEDFLKPIMGGTFPPQIL